MSQFDPKIHHRQSIRLKGYDYSSSGLYFLTICTHNHRHLFGEIVGANGRSPVPQMNSPVPKMILNQFGQIVESEWLKSEMIRDEIRLHEYVIMPNHFHCIVEIIGEWHSSECHLGEHHSPLRPRMQAKSIGSLMAGFKSSVTKKIHIMDERRSSVRNKIWQRNYWEYIVRNENEYNRISQYIRENPAKWQNDKLNGGSGNVVLEECSPYHEESWMV